MKTWHILAALTVAFSLSTLAQNPASRQVELKKGDRISFFGDSLTALAIKDSHVPEGKGYVPLVRAALQDKGVCIGSLEMLNDLVTRFERLSEAARSNDAIALIGGVLEMLQRHWTSAEDRPGQEVVELTYDKLKFLISKVEAK